MDSKLSEILIVMLYPQFEGMDDRESFDNLLRVSGLIVSDPHVKVLPLQARQRVLGFTHAWIRDTLSEHAGPSALFLWSQGTELLPAVSFFETLDQFVPPARNAIKVAVMSRRQWPAVAKEVGISHHQEYVLQEYRSTDADRREKKSHVFIVRSPPQDPLTVCDGLGLFLGVRQPRHTSSAAIPAARPHTPPKLVRRHDPDEITQQVVITNPLTGEHRIPKVVETEQPRSGRADPRREDEDERPTDKPPAPDSLPPFLKPQH